MAKQEDIFAKEEKPTYILKNAKRNCVWHEQYPSRHLAQVKLDYEKNVNHVDVSGWEIDVIYPRHQTV